MKCGLKKTYTVREITKFTQHVKIVKIETGDIIFTEILSILIPAVPLPKAKVEDVMQLNYLV